MNVKITSLFILSLGCITFCNAQEGFTAGGGDAQRNSFSVGQIDYESGTNLVGSIQQGVQHAFEIFEIEEIEITGDFSAVVSPNPTVSTINLHIENIDLRPLSFHLFDMNGRILESKLIKKNDTIISMEDYASATYILRVNTGTTTLKTFKIIKKAP